MWDRGHHADARQHQLVNAALGPVWEANHVWLIFLLVGLFNIFPSAFAILTTALFLPLGIVLIGIVLRGAAFIFRVYALEEVGAFARWWSYVFSVTIVVTPFFLGASAAAVASGRIRVVHGVAQPDLDVSWTTPFALTIGAMAVVLCTTLAAIYLAVEARNGSDERRADSYRWRALLAGAITSVLGVVGILFSISEAPLLSLPMHRT